MHWFLFGSLNYFVMQTVKIIILVIVILIGSSLKAQDTTIVNDGKKEVLLRPLGASKERVYRKIVRDTIINYFSCIKLDSSIEYCYFMHVDLIDSSRVLIWTKRNNVSFKIDTVLYRTICWNCDKGGDGIGFERTNWQNPDWDTDYSLFYNGNYLLTFNDRYNGVYIHGYRLRRYLKKNREILKTGYKQALSYILDPEHGFLDCAEYLRIFEVANIPKNKVLNLDFKRKH